MRAWERREAEHRLQQLRANQLREDPPAPVVRERKPRIAMTGDQGFPVRSFALWTVANRRQRQYQAAFGE